MRKVIWFYVTSGLGAITVGKAISLSQGAWTSRKEPQGFISSLSYMKAITFL
jgi:hypothetical protein